MVERFAAVVLLAAMGAGLSWTATHSGGGPVLISIGPGHGLHLLDGLILLSVWPTLLLIRRLIERAER